MRCPPEGLGLSRTVESSRDVRWNFAASVPTPLVEQADLQRLQLVGPHSGQDGFTIRAELDLEGLAKGVDRLAQFLFAALFATLFAALPLGQGEGATGVLLGDLRAIVEVELSGTEKRHAGDLQRLTVGR